MAHLIPRDISVCWPCPKAGTDTTAPVIDTLEADKSVPEANFRTVSAGQGSGPVLQTDQVLVKSMGIVFNLTNLTDGEITN